MGSSSDWKANSGPQRIYNYLNGLREEFEQLSNNSSTTCQYLSRGSQS